MDRAQDISSKSNYRELLWAQIGPSISRVQANLCRIPSENPRSLDHCHRMPTKAAPGSMTDEEGLVIHEIIRLNSFTSGYEVSTGFGYSALFAALAFRETNGLLKSLDCYVRR